LSGKEVRPEVTRAALSRSVLEAPDTQGHASSAHSLTDTSRGSIVDAKDRGIWVKKSYQLLAERHRIPWQGRRYDRDDPLAADLP